MWNKNWLIFSESAFFLYGINLIWNHFECPYQERILLSTLNMNVLWLFPKFYDSCHLFTKKNPQSSLPRITYWGANYLWTISLASSPILVQCIASHCIRDSYNIWMVNNWNKAAQGSRELSFQLWRTLLYQLYGVIESIPSKETNAYKFLCEL